MSIPDTGAPTTARDGRIGIGRGIANMARALPRIGLSIRIPAVTTARRPSAGPARDSGGTLRAVLSASLDLGCPLGSGGIIHRCDRGDICFGALGM